MGITEMPTPTAILAVRHPVWSFQFDDIHAQVILDSLRRMASLDVSATHFVLKQLVTLLEDKAIVKIFNSMKANSSAILKEVSDMFVDSPDIQRDCVELLLCLADCR